MTFLEICTLRYIGDVHLFSQNVVSAFSSFMEELTVGIRSVAVVAGAEEK